MQNVHCQYISPTKTCFIHQMFLAVCRVYWIVFPSIWAVLTLLIPGSFITSKCPILGLYLLYACQTSAYCQQCHQKKEDGFIKKDRVRQRSVALENSRWEGNKQDLFHFLFHHCYTIYMYLHHPSIPPSIHLHITNIILYPSFFVFMPSLHSSTLVLFSILSVTSLQPCASHLFMARHSNEAKRRRGGWVISPFTGKREHHWANVRVLHSLFPVRGRSVWLGRCSKPSSWTHSATFNGKHLKLSLNFSKVK